MGPFKKKKICVVTRNNSEQNSLWDALSTWDLKLYSQELNDRLINRLSFSHPDLIIFKTDSLNGNITALWQEIRNTKEIKHVPIIAVVPGSGSERKLPDTVEGVTFIKEPIEKNHLKQVLQDNLSIDTAIKFWGVRGSTPCANKENMVFGGNTTCVQLEIPESDEILILDSGTGIRNLGNHLMDLHETVKGRIFITHPHWDHIQGFPFFKPIYYSNNHFDIHMPPQANGGCKEILSGHLTKTFFPVTIEMIDANIEYITQEPVKQAYDIYEIEYILANHPINTAIYKIHVNGFTIVFSPDNELRPDAGEKDPVFYNRLKDFFQGADVLIHDAQYNRESYRDRIGWGHSAWEEAVNFAKQCDVKHLFLTHHDPDSDDTKLEELENRLKNEYGSSFRSIQLAREGVKFNITDKF